jgi:hypothetical protein
MCQQPSYQWERAQRAQRRHIPVHHLGVLGVLCGYGNNSTQSRPSDQAMVATFVVSAFTAYDGSPCRAPGVGWEYQLQELRGGRLDHENHDMSEKRETANADMQQTIPRLTGDIASGRAEVSIFFTKNLHCVQIFCEKENSTMLPQAMLPFIGSNARFDETPRNSYQLRTCVRIKRRGRSGLAGVVL